MTCYLPPSMLSPEERSEMARELNLPDDWFDQYDRVVRSKGRYDPSQPRHPAGSGEGGRWSPAGGSAPGGTGDKAAGPLPEKGVVTFSKALMRAMLADLKGMTAEELVAQGTANQQTLGQIGRALSAELATEFILPDAKKIERIKEKMATGEYEGPHLIKDYARATFVVGTPADADRIVAKMSESGAVIDKKWDKSLEDGYMDRKLYIRFPNGGLGEVQLVPAGVQTVKHGKGHDLYKKTRSRSISAEERKALFKESRRLYGAAVPPSFQKLYASNPAGHQQAAQGPAK